MILGQHIGKELVESLGLPKYTIGFTLRARVGEVVTVECEYMPEGDEFVPALAQYSLVPRTAKAKVVMHRAAVLGYDAWMRERIENDHAVFMLRTSKLPMTSRRTYTTEEIARFYGVPSAPTEKP